MQPTDLSSLKDWTTSSATLIDDSENSNQIEDTQFPKSLKSQVGGGHQQQQTLQPFANQYSLFTSSSPNFFNQSTINHQSTINQTPRFNQMPPQRSMENSDKIKPEHQENKFTNQQLFNQHPLSPAFNQTSLFLTQIWSHLLHLESQNQALQEQNSLLKETNQSLVSELNNLRNKLCNPTNLHSNSHSFINRTMMSTSPYMASTSSLPSVSQPTNVNVVGISKDLSQLHLNDIHNTRNSIGTKSMDHQDLQTQYERLGPVWDCIE